MPVKLAQGMHLDGFELLAPLHQGGMATLWRVVHPDHPGPLLMKLPRIGYGEAATQIVGFEVERMLMPVLAGPHVPRFVASGDFEDQPWLVMEQVPGDTLRPLLEQAPLPAERAGRTRRDGRLAVARRWFGRYTRERALAAPATQHLAQAPLLMVAIDLKHEDPALCRALHESVQRALQTTPGARLACVTVMRTARIGMDSNLDAAGRNRHVKRLVALRDWVRPLQLNEHRVTFHVLEAHDPAEALVEYARTADVDHILLGARGLTGVRRMLGSVSARVVAEAPCTATVVRVRGEPQAP